MNNDLKKYIFKCKSNKLLNSKDFLYIKSLLCSNLTEEYFLFIKEMNGIEGFVGEDSYIMVYSLERLQSLNDGYEIQKNLPNMFMFASNDLDGYVYQIETKKIYKIDLIGLDLDPVVYISDTLVGFFKYLYLYRIDG